MMLTSADVLLALDGLLRSTRTREEVAKWAITVQRANDAGTLTYESSSAQDQLWSAVTFLGGIDLKTSPDSYLYGAEDLLEIRRKLTPNV
jgi:hypothetical protein